MTARRIPDGDRALFRRACDVLRALTAKEYKIPVSDTGQVQLVVDDRDVVETARVPGMSGGAR